MTHIMEPSSAITNKLRSAIRTHYKNRCQYCGADGATEVEHILPRAKGGTDALENLTLACGPCNRRKSAVNLPPLWGSIAAAHASQAKPRIEAALQGQNKAPRSPKKNEQDQENELCVSLHISLEAKSLVLKHNGKQNALLYVVSTPYAEQYKEQRRAEIIEAVSTIPTELENLWMTGDRHGTRDHTR